MKNDHQLHTGPLPNMDVSNQGSG